MTKINLSLLPTTYSDLQKFDGKKELSFIFNKAVAFKNENSSLFTELTEVPKYFASARALFTFYDTVKKFIKNKQIATNFLEDPFSQQAFYDVCKAIDEDGFDTKKIEILKKIFFKISNTSTIENDKVVYQQIMKLISNLKSIDFIVIANCYKQVSSFSTREDKMHKDEWFKILVDSIDVRLTSVIETSVNKLKDLGILEKVESPMWDLKNEAVRRFGLTITGLEICKVIF